ncbi:hypothetical protein ACK4QX_19205 [Proteus mirabilis]|uniref:hypothetical protein n=1 Tax=Proteus mirabilis TaxID=584 RepID=UPI003919CCED
MKIRENDFWVYFSSKNEINSTNNDKIGKWMYFFNDAEFTEKICQKAILNSVVEHCKYTNNAESGVACFYLNIDDIEGHKKVIKFFLDNKLIPINKSGKFKNISFKLDMQTMNREYGDKFEGKLSLEHFIDLSSGIFK